MPDTPTQAGKSREHAAGLIDSLLLIVARVGSNVLALAWTLLLVRLLQPEAAGIALQAISAAQIASILMTLNVESGSVRVIVPARQDGRMEQASGFIRFNRKLVLITLPVLATIALLAWWLGMPMPETPATAAAMALAMVLVAMARLSARHATALGVMRKGLLPRLLTGPVVLTLGLGLAYFAQIPLLPWHVVLLYALSEGITVLVQNWLLRGDFAFMQETRGNSKGWQEWTRLGLWLMPGLIMNEYRKAILISTAGLVLTGAETSYFAVAFSIVNFINFGVVAVDVAFSPRIAKAMAAGQPMHRDKLLASSGAIKLAGLTLGVTLVLAIGNIALGWFGEEYHAARPALLIMLLIPAISVICGPSSVLLSSRGFGRSDFTGNLFGALSCVLAICGLGAMFGVTGAAVGAVLSHLLSQILMTQLCRRNLSVNPTLANLRHLLRRSATIQTTMAP